MKFVFAGIEKYWV